MSNNLSQVPRELQSRTNAGIEVSLWWSPADGRTFVTVRDVRTAERFVVPVRAGEPARDVFDHPYAHAARHSVPTAPRAA